MHQLQARVDTDLAAAQEASFARARNAEIETAITASQEAAFARARNAEAEASIAAVNAQRRSLDTGTITSPLPYQSSAIWSAASSAFYWALMLTGILLISYAFFARREIWKRTKAIRRRATIRTSLWTQPLSTRCGKGFCQRAIFLIGSLSDIRIMMYMVAPRGYEYHSTRAAGEEADHGPGASYTSARKSK